MSLPCAERCWARGMARRLRAAGVPQYQTVVDDEARWTGRAALNEAELLKLARRKKPAVVGLCFMADAFHPSVPDEWLDKMLAAVALTPHLRYILPTKRAKRMQEYFAFGGHCDARVAEAARKAHKQIKPFVLPSEDIFDARRVARGEPWEIHDWPLPNLALMLSASNQAGLDARADDFLATPAAMRILSLEPLLGELSFRWAKWQPFDQRPGGSTDHLDGLRRFDWVIVGGESGPGARPMHPDWVRSIRDQCIASGTPFLFKRWGLFRPVVSADDGIDECDPEAVFTANVERTVMVYRDGRTESGDTPPTEPGAWFMEPVGKRAAGRLLDGKLWDQYPEGW